MADSIRERLAFLDLGEEDVEVLARLRPVLERHADTFAAAFYRHLLSFTGTRELLSAGGSRIGNFDGTQVVEVPGVRPNPVPNSDLLMVADLCGDFRDELVLGLRTEDGNDAVGIVTATESIGWRYLAAWENPDYRLWVGRNRGGGYASVYDRVIEEEDVR